MRIPLLFCLCFAMMSAHAASVFTHINPQMQLGVVGTDQPCKLEPDTKFRHADVIWEGKHYDACWTRLDAETVLVIDETGDAGTIHIGTGV